MKNEEYIADFCLVSRRTLDEAQYRIFRFHYLLGADWKLCCRRLNMDRGTFFHEIYRIEQKLGRTFRELEPYALFPLDEYFNSTPRMHAPLIPFPVQSDDEILSGKKTVKTKKVIKFPVKKAA